MNHCLAQIGIEHPALRARAIDIGERLRVLEDYPTPPNCTSPYAPGRPRRDPHTSCSQSCLSSHGVATRDLRRAAVRPGR